MTLTFVFVWRPGIEASRRVTPEKFHAFTHDEQKCAECHQDLGYITFHPDPKEVNTTLQDFYGLVSSTEKSSCKRCHYTGNADRMAAMALPREGVVCILCHPAPLAAGSAPMLISLLIFGFGLFSLAAFWIKAAGISGEEKGFPRRIFQGTGQVIRILFSRKFKLVLRLLFTDVLLNQRFFKRAPDRWLIHALIFYPFLFRLTWSLAALLGSVIAPQWAVTRSMVDQNHPLTAFLFDLTGVLIIAGAAGAVARRIAARRRSIIYPDLPRTDWLAMALLGILLINGFITEGVRMAMAGMGFPGAAESAFLGALIGRAVDGSKELSSTYVIFWYFHILAAAFFMAYLPFSRLRHMFMVPLSVVVNTVLKKES
ncbi:MAG: respiratory nitrate reductase subunit gamma [Deltaproteobacteria bacterium]|nr:respiratory nitrate reductase subunit gamma [Deltaproteobacteria bacterium]